LIQIAEKSRSLQKATLHDRLDQNIAAKSKLYSNQLSCSRVGAQVDCQGQRSVKIGAFVFLDEKEIIQEQA
jgi:hypothetical protein